MSSIPNAPKQHLILITGVSGSGKSTAIDILEDLGFNYIENLPIALLPQLISANLAGGKNATLVASINTKEIEKLPQLCDFIRQQSNNSNTALTSIFLTANKPTLIRRFDETRRRHQLSSSADNSTPSQALSEAIDREMVLLTPVQELSSVIDTSNIRSEQLKHYLTQLVNISASNKLILTFQSFAFKHGVPIDTDFLFDARALPNPYYQLELRALTGADQGVINFLQQSTDAGEFVADIIAFLDKWIIKLSQTQRNYISVAIGCTGGQHRSVYVVEQLVKHFAANHQTVSRHREQDKKINHAKA